MKYDQDSADAKDGVIEYIGHGGVGSEANIQVELRTVFPGIGGTLRTNEGVVAALREEFNNTPKAGHRMFIRHVTIKKLEDFFYRTGVYVFAHIPRPLGSISRQGTVPCEAYLYEWVFGTEGFPWKVAHPDGEWHDVHLRDWDDFVTHFRAIGLDLGRDCADPDDVRVSKNIIHQYASFQSGHEEMSSLWKRIDFGARSVGFDLDKLARFLHDNKQKLIAVLRSERYEMLVLGLEYLASTGQMKEIDIGRLEVLLGDFRRATLTQYAIGLGSTQAPASLGERTETLA